jgi:very-short-patch-repair endonuclease
LGRGKIDKAMLKQYARELRKNSTDAERRLWYFLRANRLGFKFKRQVPIKGFIVDFVCHEKRLIIELDGGQHQMNQEYDAQRTTKLSQCGFQVLRFWNADVLRETNTVLEVIYNTLSPTLSRAQHPLTNPIQSAGEGADRCI